MIIAYLRKVKAFDSYVVKPQITAKVAGKVFKAQGAVKITKSGKSISLVFEVVRRDEDWQKKLEIKGIKLCFTTDLKQNDTALSKSLIEFKIDETTKKYKKETLELKILE